MLAAIMLFGMVTATSPGFNCQHILSVGHHMSYLKIQNAIDDAHSGDCVVVFPGKYFESIKTKRSGTRSNPIVIFGLKGAELRGEKQHGGRIVQINHSHIRLAGFTIDGKFGDSEVSSNYKDKLIYIEGKNREISDILIQNNILKNALGECVRIKHAKFVVLRNNSVSYCGLRDYRFGRGKKNGEAIYIGTAPEQAGDDVDETNHVYIIDNMLSPYGSECVDIKEGSHAITVKGNSCAYTKDKNSGGVSVRGHDVEVYENFFHDLAGAGVRLGGDTESDGIYNSVYNNYFLEGVTLPLKIMAAPQGKICGNQADTPKVMLGEGVPSQTGQGAFQPCKQQE